MTRWWKGIIWSALPAVAAVLLSGDDPRVSVVKAEVELSVLTGPPPSAPVIGKVSWYGPGFEGRPTATGETFDPNMLTMAHRTLPFGTVVEIRNPLNDRRVIVRVNDRGPYIDGRIADLSRRAAEELGMVDHGVIEAELRIIA